MLSGLLTVSEKARFTHAVQSRVYKLFSRCGAWLLTFHRCCSPADSWLCSDETAYQGVIDKAGQANNLNSI